MPYVSVIMPAYNAERTVGEAIDSVLKQTYTDFELIVINDCATDRTEQILREYALRDSRIRVLKNERNSGVSATRNYGVAEARGEWIAFLDSDDVWRKDKLEKQMALHARRSDVVLSYTASSFMTSEGEPYGYVMEAEEKTTYKTLLRKNLISCSSVVVKAAEMKGIRMPHDGMHEDYYVWLTLLKKHPYAAGINEPLLRYRLSVHSKSSNRFKSAKMLFSSYDAVGYSKFVSAVMVLRYSVHSISKRYRIKQSGFGKGV